ncbi:TIGR04222 domain-containing membrane protein [Streptomyces sp. NBC_00091]|uniref:TIGR04222 domain-containing membrane protein n=1 Tax=Streptomyces sp. NBC_00091 TaxID=2975648 RepID=UPI00224D76F5|nr:TIGR04222 domain-containing membrane protein [Streptomyces sp. NBC_00091]MCX5375224.1 TIGR04222 domain-containing membrane protein [Streptomyces sp. NBC_00091]
MFWILFLLLAWAGVLTSATRLLRAATEAAEPAPRPAAVRRHGALSLYEAAYLAGGPERVAVLTLLSMERRHRLLLARTGWATVLDPVGRDAHERAVLGAFGPDGQSPVSAVRRAAAAHAAVRALADRLDEAGLAVPREVRDAVSDGARSVRRAAVLVVAMAAASLAVPADGATVAKVLYWFALPMLLVVCCLAVAGPGGPGCSPWASPAGQRLLLALERERAGADPLAAVAVRGLRAVRDPDLRAALGRDTP